MINGTHLIVSSRDADADRRFFRDVLGFDFAEPPYRFEVELAVRLIEVLKRLRARDSSSVPAS